MRLALLWHLGRLVSWPHWSAHAARTVLTSIGVALGVATVVAIADVSRSVLAAFESMVDAVAGEADLEVSSPVGDVREDFIEPIAGVPGVATVAGIVEQFVPLQGTSESSIYLLGIDFLGSNLWRQQFPREAIDIDDELAFLAQADSVALPKVFLEQKHMKVGDPIGIVTPQGVRNLVVRGTIRDAPAAKLFGGATALMDLPAAQAMLGRKGRVDRIAVDVDRDADVAELTGRLRRALTQAATQKVVDILEIAPPETRGRQAEQLLFSLRTTLAIMSLGALIVGAFIVYHTIAISVMQRRREFALLNASGVEQGVLTGLCISETLVLAFPGIIAGVAAGHWLALLASEVIGMTASEIWIQVHIVNTKISVWGWMIAVAMGMSTAFAAAYAAIRATFAAPTIETLRPAGLVSDSPGSIAIPLSTAAVFLSGVWLVKFVPSGRGFASTVVTVISTQALGYIAVALAAAPIVWIVGHIAAQHVARYLPLPGAMAAENLPRQPGRSGGTVATIAATMAMAVTVAILVKSHDEMSLGWIERHFGADLFVGRGQRVRLMASAPMDAEIGETIKQVQGVEAVEIFRTIPIHLGPQPAFLQGLSVTQRLRHGGLPMVEGSLEAAAKKLIEGSGVLVSDNLAFKLRLHAGDRIAIPTPEGSRVFEIVGTYADYLGSLDLGAVMVGQEHLSSIWGDRSANLLRVWLEPDANHAEVRTRVSSELAGRQHGPLGDYFVLEGMEFISSIRNVIRRFFAATWALELVAALVGVIGVVNTQLAIVLDRAAEIGVLRTIGLSRKDIIRSVVIECGALGALGGIIGVALGLILGAQIVLVSLKLVTGWGMAFHVPWMQLAIAILVATGFSALAGYVPARAAAGIRLGQRSTD